METPTIPERVLVTTSSLHIFEDDKQNSPYDIPEEYRLEWRRPFQTVTEQDQVIFAILGYEEDGIQNRIRFTLGRNAWATPKEATNALIRKLAEDASSLFRYHSDDCTDWIAKVRGDTDFLLRDAGIPHTLGRVISTYEGRVVRHLGRVGMIYSALLHQQCDLEREAIRYQQGLIKDDTDHV